MRDFDYDCLQRKRLAQQAKHRKCGSKSRKCSMSTDYMTNKQWKERCGRVVTISMDKPITWEVFKELSKQTQEEYIRNLMTVYGANATSLAAMFEIKPLTVRRHIASKGLSISFQVGHSMNIEQREAWEKFLMSKVEEPVLEQDKRASVGMSMKKFSISFSGDIDITMISNSLIHILGNNAVGEVEIMCSLV